jgi:DNA-binding transcriptional ArsR family regulator
VKVFEQRRRDKVIKALRNTGGLPTTTIALHDATGITWGNLYVTLARLENEGIVTSWFDQGKSPRRRYYKLRGL